MLFDLLLSSPTPTPLGTRSYFPASPFEVLRGLLVSPALSVVFDLSLFAGEFVVKSFPDWTCQLCLSTSIAELTSFSIPLAADFGLVSLLKAASV
jgi:hypothetical protein